MIHEVEILQEIVPGVNFLQNAKYENIDTPGMNSTQNRVDLCMGTFFDTRSRILRKKRTRNQKLRTLAAYLLYIGMKVKVLHSYVSPAPLRIPPVEPRISKIATGTAAATHDSLFYGELSTRYPGS